VRKEEGRPARASRRRRRAALAPVDVVPTTDGQGKDIEVILASGDRIRLIASVSPDRLHSVVDVLRARC
jgi:hypothetical protein